MHVFLKSSAVRCMSWQGSVHCYEALLTLPGHKSMSMQEKLTVHIHKVECGEMAMV